MTSIRSTMPTAVMIESNEKTMSMIMICRITPEKVAPTAAEAAPFSPSSSWWISLVLFHRRKRPPAIRMRSRPEISWRRTVKRGSVRPLIQTRTNNRPIRMNMARARPILRASSLLGSGSLSTRMEMKMTLSMPSTSSSAVSVRKAIQAWGSDNSSIGSQSLRSRVRRLGVIDRGPALRDRRQGGFLAAHALDRDRVQRDLVDARIEALRALPIFLGVLRHQRVEETLPRRKILNHADPSEHDHATVFDSRIAFEAAVGEHLAGFVDLKTDPRLVIGVRAQVASRARVVHEDFAVHADVEERHAVRPAVFTNGSEPPTEPALECFARALLRHQLVRAPHLGRAAHRNLRCRRSKDN